MLLWSNGHSHKVVPVRHDATRYDPRSTHQEWEAYASRSAKVCAKTGKSAVKIERYAGAKKDKSRKAVVQSDGYVMSGWAKQSKGGVSRLSRKLFRAKLKGLSVGV
jgi:hypothetical protein